MTDLHRLAAGALIFLCFTGTGFHHAVAQTAVSKPGLTADEWAAQARASRDAGTTMDAIAAFEQAVAVDSSRSDIRLELADLLRTAGLWVRSAEQYRRILGAQPSDVPAMIGYGELLNAQYQFAPAAEHFGRALRAGLGPHDRERVLVGLGSARFGMADYAGAAQVFEGILKESPRVLTALAYLAISRRNLGDLDAAEKLWAHYLEIDPSASPARIHQIEIQELRSAIEDARRSVQSEPSNAELWAALGNLLRRKPDLPAAREAYAAAVRLAPKKASNQFLLGGVLRDLGRWSEAAEAFAAAGEDRRWGSTALYNMGYAARRASDSEKEIHAWETVSRTRPGDLYGYRRYLKALKAHGGLELEVSRARQAVAVQEAAGTSGGIAIPLARLAYALAASGQRAEASEAALKALRLDPNEMHAQRAIRDLLQLDDKALEPALVGAGPVADPASSRLRGAVLMSLGREAQAEPELKRALDAAPEDARALTAMAGCLRALGRRDEGLALLLTARAKEPGYLYAQLDSALALNEAGRFQEAADAAREAVRLGPENPVGHALLGAALKQQGKPDQAAHALEEAVALDPMDDLGAPRMLLAKVRGEMGHLEEARDLLKGDLPQDPEEMYRMAWEFVRDHYHDRTFHGQSWMAWRDRFEGRLKTPADALGAVALMLSSLDDRNTRLRSAEQTGRLFFTQRTDAPEFASTGVALGTSRTVTAERLDGNVGYVAITNLDDPASRTQIREAVEEMKTTDGVILDLRGNPGGSDSEVPQVTGLFVKPGVPTGTTITPDGRTTEKVPANAAGAPVIPESKPVVVLVDRNTASSAETLAGSLKESHRAVLVGETTYGKSGIQAPRLLPGGSVVLVVTAEHADRSGQVYTGRGIQPDVKVESAPGVRGEEDQALKKAREILKRRKDG